MPRYDLCLVWNWEYDSDFVSLMEEALVGSGMSLLQVKPETLELVLAGLESRETTFSSYFDRASDTDPRFQPLVDWAVGHKVFCINPRQQAAWAGDKATMHLEFISRGLDTPYTIILCPYADQPSIAPADLSQLGGSFAIKPACEGGGDGVVLKANSWEQVLTARQQFPHEKYLLQANVSPQTLNGRPAWFRVLFCDGAIYPCWWDPHTHVYSRVTAEERARFGLRSLRELPLRIARICGLHLFSTELAVNETGRCLAVDYVNDPLDLRLQSKAADGAPDDYVRNIAARLVRLVEKHL